MSDLILGITTIGDLLLKNTITQDNNGKTIKNIELAIPEYQRPYKWTAKNVIQLLDDIVEAKNKNKEIYRVGTLILHKKEEIYNIVDGQQRIITFALLLKALIEASIDDKKKAKASDDKTTNDTTANDTTTIRFLEQEISDNPYNRYNLSKNFLILDRRIKNFNNNTEELEYIKNNCELIVVITGDESAAFQFFDSQNARGKKLYPHDLLKAYHLREMKDLDSAETEKVVKSWEELDQKKLARLFSDYLYRIKEWIKGNRAMEFNEHNIHLFKGITSRDNFPYAQFYKGAFAYANMVNNSEMPFVSGIRNFNPFQLDTPIVAGKPFFDYAKHYFEILKDIQDNSKYKGYFINDNEIVKTLDLEKYKNGVGNRITRLLFDTSILLYVDRFCPTERPEKADLKMLDQFVVLAFIWAYSLRAQYSRLGWQSAQNYIVGISDKINSFNIYKTITEADSPVSLLSELSNRLNPLPNDSIRNGDKKNIDAYNYLHWFKKNKFLEIKNEN